MQQPCTARLRKRDHIRRAAGVGRLVLRVGQVETDRGRTVDNQIVRLRQPVEGRCVQPQTVLPDIARHRLGNRHLAAVVRAHLGVAVDQRGHPLPRRNQPRADLAADQPGGTRYKNPAQQQPPPVATWGVAPASGNSVPQSG